MAKSVEDLKYEIGKLEEEIETLADGATMSVNAQLSGWNEDNTRPVADDDRIEIQDRLFYISDIISCEWHHNSELQVIVRDEDYEEARKDIDDFILKKEKEIEEYDYAKHEVFEPAFEKFKKYVESEKEDISDFEEWKEDEGYEEEDDEELEDKYEEYVFWEKDSIYEAGYARYKTAVEDYENSDNELIRDLYEEYDDNISDWLKY